MNRSESRCIPGLWSKRARDSSVSFREHYIPRVASLSEACRILRQQVGPRLFAPYVPGKTLFRDVLCEKLGLSELDAEQTCDSLEVAGLIRFSRALEVGPLWIIEDPVEVPTG